ncbi:MAG: Fe-S cluster assembly scaffold protein NifU [Deltaproteobacteria bacterium]|nr:Fe-S cluster assembly scaffold protein NifU [Deltaproteobacteria bacterium]MBW1819635.1 Fe-S cluster assembly scaffold protein NifU [Deltaproteobacteria bacterium]MBW2284974.1 Fe-S cluster assembly scaffold protein NifU [Deltaproteobacteria bacterium]
MYSKTVMDHFKTPRNVGVLDEANGVGEVGNPLCGDMMTIYLDIQDDLIKDIKFQTFGCGAAIAVSSMLTEMAKGKTLDEAKKITNKDVAAALEGLPKNKLHCSNLGADALHQAIKNYEDRNAGKAVAEPKRQEKHTHNHEGGTCYCPYCDTEVEEDATHCKSCQLKLDHEH